MSKKKRQVSLVEAYETPSLHGSLGVERLARTHGVSVHRPRLAGVAKVELHVA